MANTQNFIRQICLLLVRNATVQYVTVTVTLKDQSDPQSSFIPARSLQKSPRRV